MGKSVSVLGTRSPSARATESPSSKAKAGKAVGPCPDEDDILAFAAGDNTSLSKERRREILAHVDQCELCRLLAAEVARDESREADDSEIPPPSEDEPLPPLVDGRFRVLGPLGRGAMGTVHRAHDEKLGVDVALKVIHDGSKAFAREVKVGRKVAHPNVCRFHDAGTSDDLAYITMEVIDGKDLARVLAAGELEPTRAITILEGIASGLGAAHAQGIVHRDLKPANVLIEDATDRPVLTDFGFAMDLGASQSKRLVGTPKYWAPEQARGERPTPASDIYSFGLIAYRLLARKDFSLSDDDALRAVPSAYRAFVARCVESKPTERFKDANAALAALRALAAPQKRAWLFAPLALVAGLAIWVGVRSTSTTSGPPISATSEKAAQASAPATSAPPAATTAATAPSPPAATQSAISPVDRGSASPVDPGPTAISSKSTIPTATGPRPSHLPSVSARASSAPVPPVSASASAPAPKSSDSDILYRH